MNLAPAKLERWAQSCLMAGALACWACGGKARSNDAPSSNSADSGSAGSHDPPQPRLCDATLKADGRAPIELDCDDGIHAVGGGFYRLELTSLENDNVIITFPSISAGFFASPACASASVGLSHDSTYLAQPDLPDTVAVLHIESTDSTLTGTLEGIFADYIVENGQSPSPVFITPTVSLRSIPITRPNLTCDCGPARTYDDHCEVPTCDAATCAFVHCPSESGICAGR